MSRLLIPNTTQVPNVLLDEVIPRLSSAPLRVLLAIVRLTYGWGKSSDRISLTQLQRNTGLSRRRVIEGIKALGNLLEIKRGARGTINEYALNLNTSTGKLLTELGLGSSRNDTSSQNSTSSLSDQKVVTKSSESFLHWRIADSTAEAARLTISRSEAPVKRELSELLVTSCFLSTFDVPVCQLYH